MELDASDKRILKRLMSNHGRSCCELAKGLGIKAQKVLKRIRNMESDGIIKGYSIILDNKKLGYGIAAIIEVTTSDQMPTKMVKAVSLLPHISGIYSTTGPPNLIIIGSFKNIDKLNEFTNYLSEIPLINKINTHLVLEKVKEDFELLV
jgi:DNA-binding Lrp family transcriptional regulator